MENPEAIAIACGDTEKDFIPYIIKTRGYYINGELMYMENLSLGNIEEVFDKLEL